MPERIPGVEIGYQLTAQELIALGIPADAEPPARGWVLSEDERRQLGLERAAFQRMRRRVTR